MKYNSFNLVRYDADEGCVFDWKEPRYTKLEDGSKEQEHLYATTLFIGSNDSIENYVEVAADGAVTELATPDDVQSEKEQAYDIMTGVTE